MRIQGSKTDQKLGGTWKKSDPSIKLWLPRGLLFLLIRNSRTRWSSVNADLQGRATHYNWSFKVALINVLLPEDKNVFLNKVRCPVGLQDIIPACVLVIYHISIA